MQESSGVIFFRWPLYVAALGWLAFSTWGSWRLYHWPVNIANTRKSRGRPPQFRGMLLLLGAIVLMMPAAILEGSWLGCRTPFSRVQWWAMTTPGLPSYHPDVAGALVIEVAFQIAAFCYSFTVIASWFAKRRSFPWHFSVLTIFITALTVFDKVVLASMIQVHTEAGIIAAARTLSFASFWLLYVRHSKRVAKTFTNGPRALGAKRASSASVLD